MTFEPGLTRRQTLLAGAAAVGVAVTEPLLRSAAARGAPSAECATKYAGYSAADRTLPYASFFAPHTAPPQPAIEQALARGPIPAEQIPPLRTLGAEMSAARGYSPAETGYGRATNGQVWVAALTDMPGVTPAMWDWWFGWHSDASAKYKLWHPDAHRFAALRDNRVETPGLSDRQRYVGNVSYVDELIGEHEQQLAIAFTKPRRFGVSTAAFGGTAICATVGSSIFPFDVGRLVHQVRPTARGSEMRSRFYLNVPGVHLVNTRAASCALQRRVENQALPPFDAAYGRALMLHCGQEMNHLAQFLPDLHARFAN